MKTWIASFACMSFCSCALFGLPVQESDVQVIAQKIWQNEGAGKVENLLFWNPNEEFLSCGIGHFIWYPEGYSGPFDERFPKFISFLEQKKVELPTWLTSKTKCPWKSREEFQNKRESEQVKELFTFLQNTTSDQALYMLERLESVLPKITQALPSKEKEIISKRFYSVLNAKLGMYALIDYVNFKGEGVLPSERYKGQGWALTGASRNG